ncbi:MAG: 4'-phosphopantetheinyl transferase superfamily protein [Bacteroidetes bacterium]|nr:4'-phosphopantetheinyl transferase superfamily protein [Bacteroidota bacterium]
MPCILNKSLPSGSLMALWRIEETEEELSSKLMLDDSEKNYLAGIKADNKRLQWLASRVLIRELVNPPGQILMDWDQHGRPYVLNYDFEVSISHSRNMAAVIVGESRCGIDVEEINNKIGRISKKFVSDEERVFISTDNSILYETLIWGAKEALFKLIGGNGVDFKKNLRIHAFKLNDGYFKASISHKSSNKELELGFEVVEGFTLVFTQ